MFFGGVNGLNRFYPEQITDNQFIPPVVITDFKIFDKPADKERMAIACGYIENQPLLLNYNENFLQFEFAALNFIVSTKNQYRYKLTGVDKDWVDNKTARDARYTNLSPGEYTLRVQGSNNDGVWNEAGVALKIIITPPPWRTWWAYLLYMFGLATAGYRTYRYRLKVLERRFQIAQAVEIGKKNQELENKNQELAEQKQALAEKNEELAHQKGMLVGKNEELAEKNAELVASHQRADRIFSALAEALPGTVLDEKYRLEEKIGSGGFGAVYRATHLSMQRAIAVKIFKPAAGNDSADALSRFQQEAVSACRINHPNAVAVLDSGISSEGIAYLVMELLKGHTLTAELRHKKVLTINRVAQILLPICDVLSKAHSIGIVHRDIKPDNIFLHRGEAGEIVKVVDFGIAKLMEASASIDVKDLTATGGIIGTPTYMAPERLEARPYDGRSDVYSLGVLLYEMLCGQLPFRVGPSGLVGIIRMHLAEKPQPLRQINPDISPAIEAVVLQALEKDPKKRPSAKELSASFLAAAGIDADQLNSLDSSLESDVDRLDESAYSETVNTLLAHNSKDERSRYLRQVEDVLQLLLKCDVNKQWQTLNEACADNERLRSTIEAIATVPGQEQPRAFIAAEKLKQVEEIFFTAIEMAAEQRSAYLSDACGGDEEMRRKVEALICADQQVD
jgi:serine/threonine protein kinase